MTYSQLQADILNYKIYSRRRRAVDIAYGRYCVRSREEPVATAAKRKWNETADAASAVALHRRAEFLMLDNTESTTISSADTHLRRNRVELKHVQKGHDWWWCQRTLYPGHCSDEFQISLSKNARPYPKYSIPHQRCVSVSLFDELGARFISCRPQQKFS
jgi:hypothetical protein